MYDTDLFTITLSLVGKQSFGTDQLPIQIGELSVVLYCLLFLVTSQNPFKNSVSNSNLGVTVPFLSFPLGLLKNNSLNTPEMERFNEKSDLTVLRTLRQF